jgi:hypothetical protein
LDAGATDSEHLTVLTVRGKRIVHAHELTSPAVQSASNGAAKLDWSAAIGTGYTARGTTTGRELTGAADTSNDAPAPRGGVTASSHWTASIGTGTAEASAAKAVPHNKQLSSSGALTVDVASHWTSKIGSGHTFDSTRPAMYASATKVR